MMARLVALIASIRPTVRRVTETLATPARTKISTMPAPSAMSIWRANASRSSMSRPTSRCAPSGKRDGDCAQLRAASDRLGGGLKLPQPAAPRRSDGQALRLPASGSKCGIGEQVDAAIGPRRSGMLRDGCNELAASARCVGALQGRQFGRDCLIRAAAHVGRGRPVDVAEQRDDRGAEHGDADQRQPQRRGA